MTKQQRRNSSRGGHHGDNRGQRRYQAPYQATDDDDVIGQSPHVQLLARIVTVEWPTVGDQDLRLKTSAGRSGFTSTFVISISSSTVVPTFFTTDRGR